MRALARPVFRGTELGLLLPVALLVALGFLSVIGARSEKLSTTSLIVPAAFLALAVGLHLALALSGFRGDQVLLGAAPAAGVTARHHMGLDIGHQLPDLRGGRLVQPPGAPVLHHPVPV